MLMKKFPFSIYYLIEGDVVVIFRILDCRKDPDKIRKALSDSSNFDPGPPQ